MNKEKRIEEMARMICKSKNPNMEKDCPECIFDCMCDIQDGCEVLFEKGYRKASEVAREISRDIIEPVWEAYKNSKSEDTVLLVALICEGINTKLQKKYIDGEDTNVLTNTEGEG